MGSREARKQGGNICLQVGQGGEAWRRLNIIPALSLSPLPRGWVAGAGGSEAGLRKRIKKSTRGGSLSGEGEGARKVLALVGARHQMAS